MVNGSQRVSADLLVFRETGQGSQPQDSRGIDRQKLPPAGPAPSNFSRYQTPYRNIPPYTVAHGIAHGRLRDPKVNFQPLNWESAFPPVASSVVRNSMVYAAGMPDRDRLRRPTLIKDGSAR